MKNLTKKNIALASLALALTLGVGVAFGGDEEKNDVAKANVVKAIDGAHQMRHNGLDGALAKGNDLIDGVGGKHTGIDRVVAKGNDIVDGPAKHQGIDRVAKGNDIVDGPAKHTGVDKEVAVLDGAHQNRHSGDDDLGA